MELTGEFQFSQGNLQDYVDCPRRFQLRYLLQVAWPAVEAEPAAEYEAQVLAGEAFHRLVHQHLLGIVSADTVRLPALPLLEEWWRAYLACAPADLPPLRFPEVTLSAPLGAHRLVARYDLIALEPAGRAVIVDWKTSAKRPTTEWLVGRLQTRVYRYLLVRAGASLWPAAPAIRPEQVEMIYWFANFPEEPERLLYDAVQYAADGELLAELAAEIAQRADPVFPLTSDVRRCLFCVYRSLCGRGAAAGDLAQADDEPAGPEESTADWADRFDFEQVAEIAF